jgi:hypothetical protein
MILKTQEIIGTGAYADVFRPPLGATVYKVFAGPKHPKNSGPGPNRPEDDERRDNTFASECRAYELVSADPSLRVHIPRFLGRRVISDIVDVAGKSVLEYYIPDHCYAMEYIEGKAIKLGNIPDERRADHINATLSAFCAAGVQHLTDLSIFLPDDAQNFKFIDFAISESEEFR